MLQPIDALESRRLLSSSPKLSLATSLTVPAGQSIQVPIAGASYNGRALAYAVNQVSGLTATFHPATNTFLELNTTAGTMRFELFDDLAPETSARIRGLAQSGFFDGLDFFRVVDVNGFEVAQSGSPNNDGTGGPDALFDDEFNADLIFDSPGLLAMGIPGNNGEGLKDANRSEFFVTGAAARDLDFNHTIFGQLVRGGKVLGSILNVPTDTSYKPTTDVVIRTARVVSSPADGVLQIHADSTKAITRTLSVTATDTARHASKASIKVSVVPDTNGTPPILADVPAVIHASPGATLSVPVRAVGRPLDRYEISAAVTAGQYTKATLDPLTKNLELTLDPNYTGPLKITVGVKDIGAVSRGLITLQPGDPLSSLRLYDTQSFTVVIGGAPVTAGAASALHAYPDVKLNGQLIATFNTAGGASTNVGDYAAQVEWGDGDVLAAADIRPIDANTFGVYGTHTYARTTAAGAPLPLRVKLSATDGETVTLKTAVTVADVVETDADTGVLRVSGTNDADDVELRLSHGKLVIRVGLDTRTVLLDGVDHVAVDLFGGNDNLVVDAGVLAVSVDGGDGADTLVGGDNADTLVGGAGNDSINGGAGNDSIDGGAGNDRLGGDAGDDVVHGGDGDDSILGGSGKNKLYGDGGDDRLTGSAGPELLSGGDGMDKLYGRAGDDTLDGGGASDRLYGEDGNDVLIGGGGNDRCYGGTGNDTLYGNAGGDTLDGGEDSDKRGDDDPLDVIRSI